MVRAHQRKAGALIPFNDGLLEAKESNQPGWVEINWLYPGTRRFSALKLLKQLDRAVKEQGYQGWLAYSEWQYRNMHKVLIRFGCYPYAGDAKYLYFKKAA